ncbi:MAG: DUF6438 domain-containing protein [Flavobacteriales bacterium]|nr:DUF6438 domain-containing protein [Flavobacteriales bacterium]
MKLNIKFLFTISIALLLLVAGCKSKRETATTTPVEVTETPIHSTVTTTPTDSLHIFYGRTPCFGMCPYFELKVYTSGYAVYEGKNFVDRIGFYHTTFDKASLQKVLTVAESIGYFSFLDSYDNDKVTDLPTVTTTLTKDGNHKTVASRYKAPRELEQLYHELDFMIEDAKWHELKSRH